MCLTLQLLLSGPEICTQEELVEQVLAGDYTRLIMRPGRAMIASACLCPVDVDRTITRAGYRGVGDPSEQLLILFRPHPYGCPPSR